MRIDPLAIAERRQLMINGAQGVTLGMIAGVARHLARLSIQGLSWHEDNLEASLFYGLIGDFQDCIVIDSTRFPEHRFVITGHDHGDDLLVARLVVLRPRMWRTARRMFTPGASRGVIGSELDTHEALELGGLLSTIDSAMDAGIRMVARDLPALNREDSESQLASLISDLRGQAW